MPTIAPVDKPADVESASAADVDEIDVDDALGACDNVLVDICCVVVVDSDVVRASVEGTASDVGGHIAY